MKYIFLICLALISVPVIAAQGFDAAVVGGGGFAAGEEQRTHGIATLGASLGYPYSGRHRLQFDYLFQHPYTRFSENLHFFTGSYVLQGTDGRARPYFQVGAGAGVQTLDPLMTRFGTVFQPLSKTSFALVLAAGLTVDMGESLFLRPQLRVYGHVGPTITVLPSLALGYRF